MSVRRLGLWLCGVVLCACEFGLAQQFRNGSPPPPDFFKAAVERHLQSKHPLKPSDPRKPIPGKYLLNGVPARASQLQARIQQSKSAYRRSQSVPNLFPRSQGLLPTVAPGIQLRDALQAGSISNSVVSGDFNRDGHMDFVVANGGSDDLWIYLGKGDGTFQLPRIIPLTKGLTPVYLAAADLRGNGILDLIVCEFDTSTIGVLMGNGDGTFGYEQQYLLPQPPGALVVDDFNGDGKLDIAAVMVTVNYPGQQVEYLATLLGSGTGNFAAPVITTNPGFYSTAYSITSGDVNNDGLPDVLIVGPGLENSQIYLNAGNGTFTPGPVLVANGPFNVVLAGALADVNGDGCLDATIADGNGYVWVLPGDCAGNFPQSSYVPMGDSNASIKLADVNGDGHLDIVTTTISLLDPIYGQVAGNMMAVAYGDGAGNFTSGRDFVGTGISYSAAVADFNSDGHLDVVSVSPDTETATLYVNDGTGDFGSPEGEWIGIQGVGILNAPISAPSFADLNGDGKPDILLLDEGYNGEYFITSLLNDGTGRFGQPITTATGANIVSQWMGDYRLGDFRNTGHLDFVAIGLDLAYSSGTQYILFAPGNGDGTFGKSTFVATPGAEGEMTIGDFNGDGKLDFVAVGESPTGPGWVLTTFLGNGNGTFSKIAATGFSDSGMDMTRVFSGDFNRDGKLDVIVYDTGNGGWTPNSNVWEFLGNGDGTFQPGIHLFSSFQPMTMADVNGDSIADIVRYDFMWPDGTTETFGTPRFTTYLNQASGAFTQSSSYAPYGGVPLDYPPYLQDGDPMTSSFAADLNGDGKPDEIAFQQQPPFGQGGDYYAQILMGNGDGTFTPTYDIFNLHKIYGFPAYAHHLDGSSASDLLELDGSTSSMHIFKGGPAPSLQLALEEIEVTGNAGCGWVFLNLPSNSDTNVILSSSVPGVIVPASTTVLAGSLSQRFCYTVSASHDWHQVFDIRAQLGSDTAVAYAWQSYLLGFTESISPNADQAIYPGQSTTPVTISVTPVPGYSSTVQLSCLGLLAGETCSFGQNTLNISPGQVASTTLKIKSSPATRGGSPVIVLVSDAMIAKRQALIVNVVPLVVTALGGLVQTTSPGTGSGQIVISGIPPYQPSCSGLPAGATCSFSGSQDAYPNQTFLSLTVNVPSGVQAQNYAFNVGVASGPTPASAPFTLAVQDFALQPPSPSNSWGLPGTTTALNLNAQSINSFSSSINVTCTMNSGTCTGGTSFVSPNGSGVSVGISEPASAPLGADTVTVTGTYGPVSHTISFPFYVADYDGTLSATTLTIAQGQSGSVTGNLTATQGFSDTITFSCNTGRLSCQFSPPTLQLTGANPQTITVTIKAPSSTAVLRNAGWTVLYVSMFPFAMILGVTRKRRSRRLSAIVGMTLLVALSLSSCGGGSATGGGGGGGGGPYTVPVTVNSVTVDGRLSKALGTIQVTVTQ